MQGENPKYPPLSMDIHSRNIRLYEFLVSMGHIVSPILEEGTENIKGIYVTAGLFLNHFSQDSTETSVSSGFQRGKVTDSITATESLGDVVIKFPTKL